MTPYIVVFMISIGLFALSDRVKYTQRKPIVFISVMALCLLAGMRAVGVGTDTRVYLMPVYEAAKRILVVIGHIYSNQTIFNWLYSFHMPLFFLAAGWVYKEKTVLADIKRRIQTIVIPYFSFGFLVLIYWQLMERKFRDSDMSFIRSTCWWV